MNCCKFLSLFVKGRLLAIIVLLLDHCRLLFYFIYALTRPRSTVGRTHTFVSPSAGSRGAVVSYCRKYVHEVLVNRLGLSLLRKSVVRLTDRPDMNLDVYCRRKTTTQQQQQLYMHLSNISDDLGKELEKSLNECGLSGKVLYVKCDVMEEDDIKVMNKFIIPGLV